MKVWVAMRFYADEETIFLGLGADKEAAKTFASGNSKLAWQDSNDGKEAIAETGEFEGYRVFEETVWQ